MEAEDELSFTVTKRGATAIMCRGYYHTRYKNDKNLTELDELARFSCERRVPGCQGKIHVNLRTKQLIEFEDHSHDADPDFCDGQVMRRNINQAVVEDQGNHSVFHTYNNAMKSAQIASKLPLMPTVRGCRRNLEKVRAKHKTFVETRTAPEIDLTGEIGRTKRGANFILADVRTADPPGNIIFATDAFIRLMATVVHILHINYTFKSCPRVFYQLFTIHGNIGGKFMLLLTPSWQTKKKESYIALFWPLRDRILFLVPAFNAAIQWYYVMTDFENAMYQDFHEVFPDAKLKGCFFHHCHAVFRKLAGLEVRLEYDEKGWFYNYARDLMALILDPPDEIPAGLAELVDSSDGRMGAAHIRFHEYYVTTWCMGFRPEFYSVHGLSERTNNNQEGWQNKINGMVKASKLGPHGTVRDVLKEEQHLCEGFVELFRAGKNISTIRKRLYKDLDDRIAALNQRWHNGKLTLLEFVAVIY